MSLNRRSVRRKPAGPNLFTLGSQNWNFVSKVWQKLLFYQHSQPLYDVMRKKGINSSLFKAWILNIKTHWETTVQSTCYSLTIHVKKFAIGKRLLILLMVEDVVDWVLFTLSRNCFIKANLGDTLSSRTRSLFSSILTVKWCNSTGLVHSWVWDQS